MLHMISLPLQGTASRPIVVCHILSNLVHTIHPYIIFVGALHTVRAFFWVSLTSIFSHVTSYILGCGQVMG
jgi:hypothetical protein